MDAQFPDDLKTKIEETTGETIQMVIATSSNPSSFNLLFICPSSIHLHHHWYQRHFRLRYHSLTDSLSIHHLELGMLKQMISPHIWVTMIVDMKLRWMMIWRWRVEMRVMMIEILILSIYRIINHLWIQEWMKWLIVMVNHQRTSFRRNSQQIQLVEIVSIDRVRDTHFTLYPNYPRKTSKNKDSPFYPHSWDLWIGKSELCLSQELSSFHLSKNLSFQRRDDPQVLIQHVKISPLSTSYDRYWPHLP